MLRVVVLCLLSGVIAVSASGCLMQRTVKEGDAVVARGYVVKAPLIDP